jgi:hypothetical protein
MGTNSLFSAASEGGAEVVIVDQARRQVPTGTGISEMADEFALFGIDANDGETTARESVAKVTEVEELMVAIGTVIGGKLLVAKFPKRNPVPQRDPARAREPTANKYRASCFRGVMVGCRIHAELRHDMSFRLGILSTTLIHPDIRRCSSDANPRDGCGASSEPLPGIVSLARAF